MSDICIIIPFRDRQRHLDVLLRHLRDMLPDTTEYIVVEQSLGNKFNRGLLLNVGFNATTRDRVIFHDVDLVPSETLAQQYVAPWTRPIVHFGCRFGRYNNTKSYFGGVVGFCRHAFPGFSNRYYGWGGEDDSLLRRCSHSIARPAVGAYTDLEFLPTVRSKLQRLDASTKCMTKWEVRDSECYETDNHNTLDVQFIETQTHGCRWLHVPL